jgi:hypothetical protein
VRKVRRVTRVNTDIVTVDSSTPIMVSNTGNDQTLLTSVWRVIHWNGRDVMMTGAFAGRNAGEVFPVVTAVAKLIGEDGVPHVAIAHEALYDTNPAQTESLLSVHQSLRDKRNGIDEGHAVRWTFTVNLVHRQRDSVPLSYRSTLTVRNVFSRSYP